MATARLCTPEQQSAAAQVFVAHSLGAVFAMVPEGQTNPLVQLGLAEAERAKRLSELRAPGLNRNTYEFSSFKVDFP